jgi:hypothetical protein
MKKLIAIAAAIFAFSPLLVHAEGNDEWRNKHPDARNDRQLSELNDRHPVAHSRVRHVTNRAADITHRVVKDVRRAVGQDHSDHQDQH